MAIDLGAVLAIGGPTGVITAILVILIRAAFDARKDRREQQASDVTTESGIVDNAKKVLDLVRGETDRMDKRIIQLMKDNEECGSRNKELEKLLNEQDDRIARQHREIEFLGQDLKRARAEIDELRNNGTGSTAPVR